MREARANVQSRAGPGTASETSSDGSTATGSPSVRDAVLGAFLGRLDAAASHPSRRESDAALGSYETLEPEAPRDKGSPRQSGGKVIVLRAVITGCISVEVTVKMSTLARMRNRELGSESSQSFIQLASVLRGEADLVAGGVSRWSFSGRRLRA